MPAAEFDLLCRMSDSSTCWKKIDEISSHPTTKNSLRQCQSCLSGLERGVKKKSEVSFGILVKIHKINDVESPAGRWRTEETGSRQDGTAGDMMSCYWLSDSRSYRLLSRAPGCGTAVVRPSRSCKVCLCSFKWLKEEREKKDGKMLSWGGSVPEPVLGEMFWF